MSAVTSQRFGDPLMCALKAVTLSKSNPACARHQVPETRAKPPLAWGLPASLEVPAVWFSRRLCFHKLLSSSCNVHGKNVRDCAPAAPSRKLCPNFASVRTVGRPVACPEMTATL